LIVISDLPQKCDDSSLRIKKLSGSCVILEVAVENVVKEVLKSEKGKEAEDEDELMKDKQAAEQKKKEQEEKKKEILKTLQKKEEEVSEELQRTQSERAWLENYAAQQHHPKGKAHLTTEQATEFLSFYSDNLSRLDQQEHDLQEQLEQLRKSIQGISETRKVRSLYLLLAEAQGDLSFSLSYLMPNAHWTPTYDIRVHSANTSLVELTYHGVITNSTGEDWKEVQLSLSTAQPQIGGMPPTLTTSHVRFPAPRVRKALKKRGGLSSPSMKRKAPLMEMKKEAEYMTTEAKESATSTTFRIPRLATINSDSQPHKVTINIETLEGHPSYTIIPRLSKHAYLRTKASNTCNYPFLKGKASVFMDDTFVASSDLKSTNPGEELSLYLGSDPTLVVDFKENLFNSSRGFISKSSVTQYTNEISIKNTKNVAVTCDLFTQVPKSQEDRIKVNLIEPAVLREGVCLLVASNNSLHWPLTIQPGDTFSTTVRYEIEYPFDRKISFQS